MRYFRISERVRFELRMEFYNFSNTYMPDQPVMTVTSSTFGRSWDMAVGNLGREIQYTTRIHF